MLEVDKKFVGVHDISDYEIMTDTGWSDIARIGKTIKYEVWHLTTENYDLKCADTHIVFKDGCVETYVKDLNKGDRIITEQGLDEVVSVVNTKELSHMYDLEVADENHRYYTNGILSHNTLWLTHLASSFVKSGQNVVYFTMEVSENEITKRIDANVLKLRMDDLSDNLRKTDYNYRVKNLKKNDKLGRLFVKEYATGYPNKIIFQQYIQDLKLKRDFVPDVIIMDYVNICSSSRIPVNQSNDSYRYIKYITEELRALSIEENVALLTATQLNRENRNKGADSMDDGGTADSYALPMTLDYLGGIIQDDDMFKEGKYLLKVLKTRFGGNRSEVYTIGVDRSHMLLHESETQDLPMHLKDRMAFFDKRRADVPSSGKDAIFVYDDEL